MKIIPCNKIKEIDERTVVEQNINSLELMERAAGAITEEVVKYADTRKVLVFAGPGNNGGDALAVARLLSYRDFEVKCILLNVGGGLSPECEANRDRLVEEKTVDLIEITKEMKPFVITPDMVVIDGLFGSGLNKPLTGGFAALVKMINKSKAKVFSIDIPSGLMGENNSFNSPDTVIHADRTFCIQLDKLAFYFRENRQFTGEITKVNIGLSDKAIAAADTNFETIEESYVKSLIKPKSRFCDKNDNGRGLLVAGSHCMSGAAVMAARACLRSGIGVLSVHVPQLSTVILQTLVPEAIVSEDIHEQIFTRVPDVSHYDSVGVGPGLRRDELTAEGLEDLMSHCRTPMVIDADAINIIAGDIDLLKLVPQNSILTPHTAELERLIGKCSNSYERITKAADLAERYNLYIVVKGAYTVIVTPRGHFYINTTGNPGMAKGGSGDVLTGMLLALLAQGYRSEEAAVAGVYVHGLAGDLAVAEKGVMGMTAADIAEKLPQAWMKIC